MILIQIVRLDRTDMQETDMAGVDVTFQRLKPVAVALQAPDFRVRVHRCFDFRQGRRRGLVFAHIDPDQAVGFVRLIRFGMDLVLEVHAGGDGRHVDALAVDVELPAMIDAAYAVFFVAADEQRRAAMWAAMVHDAYAA